MVENYLNIGIGKSSTKLSESLEAFRDMGSYKFLSSFNYTPLIIQEELAR